MAESPLTSDVPKRLPLVLEPENRDSTTAKDARLVNCYMESGPQKGDAHIFKRPGYGSSSQPSGGAANGYGVYNWLGDLYCIFGNTVYKNGAAVPGTVDTTNGVYKFSQSLGSTPRLQMGNGVKAYNYDSGGGLAVIASSFPSSFVKGWSFLDQTTYVMDANANIQGSDLNDTTVWDALNTLQAQIEPDGGVALAKQLSNVIAFKGWTTEVFYDAGNVTGSPLGRVPGAKCNYGCASADSVQSIDGVLYWMGSTQSGTLNVMMMDALRATPISTKPIERLLDGIDLTTIFSWQLAAGQHKFYILTSKVGNLTLAFDIAEHMWAQWTDTNGNYVPIVASAVDSSRRRVIQHETNGKLYYANATTYQDDGAVITVDLYTPSFDAGTRRTKECGMIEFIADRQPGSIIQVRNSDDDYQTWSDYRTVDLNDQRPQLPDNGSFSRRALNIRHQSNTTLRLQAVEMQLDLGTL